MEQKKTLWIIAAVGTFLLVVLGIAGVLYSTSKDPTPTITAVTPSNGKDKDSQAKNSTEASSKLPVNPDSTTSVPTEVEDMVLVSKNTTIYDLGEKNKEQDSETETTIDLNALKSEISGEAIQQPQSQNINITLQLPEKESSVVKTPDFSSDYKDVAAKVTAPKPVSSSSNKGQQKTYSAPAQKKTSTASSGSSLSQKQSNPAVTTVQKPQTKNVTQYWVQVASYSNKKGAENAKYVLDDNKISSDIFTFEDKKDNLFYRVRIGPYTTKSEAEYWQARVLKIPYFEGNDSYVTKTTR